MMNTAEPYNNKGLKIIFMVSISWFRSALNAFFNPTAWFRFEKSKFTSGGNHIVSRDLDNISRIGSIPFRRKIIDFTKLVFFPRRKTTEPILMPFSLTGFADVLVSQRASRTFVEFRQRFCLVAIRTIIGASNRLKPFFSWLYSLRSSPIFIIFVSAYCHNDFIAQSMVKFKRKQGVISHARSVFAHY